MKTKSTLLLSAMLLLAAMLISLPAEGQTWYKKQAYYDYNNGDPVIKFTLRGAEWGDVWKGLIGHYSWSNPAGSETFYFKISKDGGANYQRVVTGAIDPYAGELYINGSHVLHNYNMNGSGSIDDPDYSPVGRVDWSCTGAFGGVKDISFAVHLTDNQWRNCNIKCLAGGYMGPIAPASADVYSVSQTNDIVCGYSFGVRQISWNGEPSIAPDGTVTIPYQFEGTARNTDGETHICSRVDGSYSGAIGYRAPADRYAAGVYTFNLSTIGKTFTSGFTIEPYHEFTHSNDKDANNGVRYYSTFAGMKKVLPLPKAAISKCAFNQLDHKVVLNWNVSNTNYGNGKWVIYRNGVKIAVVPQSQTKYEDVNTATVTNFPYESEVKYQVWYVMKGWDENTKARGLGSPELSVSTKRHVYVNKLKSESLDTAVVLTWETYSYPMNWGHAFKLYIDDVLADSIFPTSNNQKRFHFEHRSPSTHTDRTSGHTGSTFWIEEPIDPCVPHDYKVVGIIGSTNLDQVSVKHVSIRSGTDFYSLTASKAAFAGQVRLAWHVNLRGSTTAKTYVVERRVAEQNGAWTELSRFKSDEEYLTYTDETVLPGIYYEYRVTVIDICENGSQLHNEITDIGFAQTTGTVSGRVTYGSSGMAVQGAHVVARKTNEEADGQQYHALRFWQTTGELEWNFPSTDYAAGVFNNPFSIQLWVYPDSLAEIGIINLQGASLGMTATGKLRLATADSAFVFFDATLKAQQYNHITLTRDTDTFIAYVMDIDANGLPIIHTDTLIVPGVDLSSATHLSLGGMTGYMDEFRLWKKVLTATEIENNYDRLLVGNEANLETYWTFDEGLESRSFDYSREGSTYHEHHCSHGADVASVTFVPEALSLKAITDADGNYIIMGIPFAGEGTTYAIIPTLGIHEFNPTQQLRFISANSLVHNSTDFDDISSFPVSGVVYYAGTDYPVSGCNFNVDGEVCSKDGDLITSDDYGHFTISVPIGEHFIQVKKQGHTFVNGGRYPEDLNGTGGRVMFNQAKENLTFIDTTLVNLTGRVVGGDIQGNKPVGFGLSTNNIGAATLTLLPQNSDQYRLNVLTVKNGTEVDYQTNPNTAALVGARPDTIRSTAWRGAGAENCSKLFIRTDSATGEFSAMVPPLVYSVTGIHVDASGLDVLQNPISFDMTNPQMSSKDSVMSADSTMQYYEYHTKLVQTYHSEPTFTVVQHGHDDGSFGIDSIEIKDALGTLKLNDIHHVTDGAVQYTYGYPLFVMGDSYQFDMEGYEEYVNRDDTVPVYDRVPLADVVVTIDNALSSAQQVCGENNEMDSVPGSVYNLQSNQLALDSMGRGSYLWKGGIPNITSPFTRAINIYYDIDGRQNNWHGNPLNGIVLGDMPTGNNFVTAGPDMVNMILRDPPGSQSFSSWETGTVKTKTTIDGKNTSTDNTLKSTMHLGGNMKTGAGIGVFVVAEQEAKADAVVGTHSVYNWENTKTLSKSVTTTKTISTNGTPEYDGAEGDVYIGTSTNLIFGKVRNVDLYRNTDDTTKAHVDLRDAVTTGLEFKTDFTYTQHYIEHDMIPNYRLLRNALLQYAPQPEAVTNTGEGAIFVTSLQPSAPNYGADGTYLVVPPAAADKEYSDTVAYYNNQITKWQAQLAFNEQEKVEAYQNRADHESNGRVTNYSFDAGSSVTIANTVDSTDAGSTQLSWKWTGIAGFVTGFTFNKFGFTIDAQDESGSGKSHVTDTATVTSATFSFTLKDEDTDDAISVDVYTGTGSLKSPIFRTRGGQTCNPYEGATLTKYYQPGTTIMEATMQVEMPKIEVVQPLITDVTSGTAANFELHLMNQSEVNADCYFRLLVVDTTNPNGAQLLMDGKPIADGRIIYVPYGQTVVKSMQLKQSDAGILDYMNIAVVLASISQSDPMSRMAVIADTAHVSAQFVPSASPVDLTLSTTTMNTLTGTDLVLTIKDFDRNYHNQKAFRLQYKPQGGDWTLFHEFVLNQADSSNLSELLPAEGASVPYTLSMYDYADGTYLFRVASVSTFGADEIIVLSDEIELVKNLSRPRPLGLAEPADGILDIGDELSVTFNQEFVNGELTDTKNFLITGVLNGAEIEHQVALRMYDSVPEPAAATDAQINLIHKDFSIDTWLYIQSDGTLLRHGLGANMLNIGTNSEGQLTIAIGDSLFTSQAALPHNKWLFLAVSYHHAANSGELSAAVAYDDVTAQLFESKPAPVYENKGPLYVGGGAAAAMHELLLWDDARDIVTALEQRSVTKNPATRHLIGYWKMNEGEGLTVRDYSRSRHMAMQSESWYLNNINKAVMLDSARHIAMCTATVPPMPLDDYAAEMWVRMGAQGSEAQLFQLGQVGIYANADGDIVLESGNNQWPITGSHLANNEWRHILFNVRRLGTAAVYIDGERALTVNANAIGDLASDSLIIGARRTANPGADSQTNQYIYDRHLTGAIDEVRLWKTTIASDMLASKRKLRLNGDEPGLSLYYPFEKKELDEYNQIVVSGTMDELTGNGTAATFNSQIVNSQIVNYIDDAPALREKPTPQNVAFSFTASSTKIVIDIEEEPETVEGCTLNFTVRDVRSTTGNYSLPATWTAFVHRNELAWEDTELTAVQETSTAVTLSSAIINRSGTPQRWVLSELPAWLTASQMTGMLNPMERATVTFTVSEATPIGKYEQTIYASGNNGIETPLTLSLVVVGDVPEWNVDPTGYAYSMDLIGQLDIFGVSAEDEDDVVAAFIGDECRGVAHPQYRERYDGYYLTLTVYGDAADNDQPITFRAYDASTGITYSQVSADRAVTYQALSLVGKYNDPVLLSVEDKVEQHIALRKGWNWISLNVTTDDMSPMAVLESITDHVLLVKGQTNDDGFLQHGSDGWTGVMDTLRNNKMYAVQVDTACDLRLVGKRVSPNDCVISLNENWNWIGYYEQQRLTVTDALAPMDPQDGDIIRSQRNICYYDDYEWVGSLLYMEPGAGYIVYNTAGAKQFAYPGSSVAAVQRRAAKLANDSVTGGFTPIDPLTYPYNMTLVAEARLENSRPLALTDIAIFDGNECRTVGKTDGNGLLYLIIQGENPTTLTAKVQGENAVFEAHESIDYETDAILGSRIHPFVLHFDNALGISNTNADIQVTKILRNGILYILRGGHIYTATGQKVE